MTKMRSAYDQTVEYGKELAQVEVIKKALRRGFQVGVIADLVSLTVQKVEEMIVKIKAEVS